MALALGIWDVTGLAEIMTARQFREWAEYYALEPFGQERVDLGHAIVASTMANLWTSKRHAPADFMPTFGETKPRRRQQTQQEAHEAFKRFMMAHNARMASGDR